MFKDKTDVRVQALGFVIAYNAGISRYYCVEYVADFCAKQSGAQDNDEFFSVWCNPMDDNIEKYMLAVCIAILDEVRVEDAALMFDPRVCIDALNVAIAKHGHGLKADVEIISLDRALAGLVC